MAFPGLPCRSLLRIGSSCGSGIASGHPSGCRSPEPLTFQVNERVSQALAAYTEVHVHHSSRFSRVSEPPAQIFRQAFNFISKRRNDKSFARALPLVIVAHFTIEYRCVDRRRYAITFTVFLINEL